MDTGKIALIFTGLVLIGSGVIAVVLFTQGSIIGEPSTVSCEWTDLKTQDGESFQSFDNLNESLKEIYGDDWRQQSWERWNIRKNSETGNIQNKLNLECGGKRVAVE